LLWALANLASTALWRHEERKLNMSCLYSTACVYGLTALSVAIWLIPLLFVIWRWVKAPIRIRDLVFLGLLGLIFLIQGVSALIGPNVMMGLIYILAGVSSGRVGKSHLREPVGRTG
jgi:hypothetical protein